MLYIYFSHLAMARVVGGGVGNMHHSIRHTNFEKISSLTCAVRDCLHLSVFRAKGQLSYESNKLRVNRATSACDEAPKTTTPGKFYCY